MLFINTPIIFTTETLISAGGENFLIQCVIYGIELLAP